MGLKFSGFRNGRPHYKFKPNKAQAKEFKEKMDEIDEFCANNRITQSSTSDSYYFKIDGVDYRVSNHTVEASNRAAYDELTGETKRQLYHPDGRKDDTVYITAGKTRIIDIYNDLVDGYKLDGRGYRKEEPQKKEREKQEPLIDSTQTKSISR